MKEFDEYTSKFDMTNRITKLKYNHSYRVSKLSNMLANQINLENEDIKLATKIGLLHDIGRFEQVKKFNTLTDINTMDHGDFGAYLLFEQGLIELFDLPEMDYNIVKTCVKEHNKYCIDKTKKYTPRELVHLKIIKDADKIDIYNIWANLDEIEIETDGKISKEVKDDFFEHRMIRNFNKKTNADSVIGTLSYMYEIYFNQTYSYIYKEDFINKFYERIPNKEQFKEFFEYADEYIKGKVKGEADVRKKVRSLKCRKK